MNLRLASPFALLSFLAASAAAPPVARAQDEPVQVEAAAPLPTLSITFSPIHLVMPVVEVTGELRLAPTLSAAIIGGAGRLGGDRVNAVDDRSYSVFELGAQVRWYALGDFRSGLQLGAEALYLEVATDDDGVSATGEGLALGPFVGYKHTFPIRLTLDAQVGAQALAVRADSGRSSAEDKDVIVLLNLNAGWSF